MSRGKTRNSRPGAGRDETTAVEPVRKQRVFALGCPTNVAHRSTRVYRTDGATRYCVCDDCGATWKQIGPRPDDPAPASPVAPVAPIDGDPVAAAVGQGGAGEEGESLDFDDE